MNKLVLNYRPEDNWHGELLGRLSGGDFCGKGSAWFTTEQISAFCKDLEQYPIQADSSLELRGGFYSDDGKKLVRCSFGITITPHDALGTLRAKIELAEPARGYDDADMDCALIASLLFSYSDLNSFRSALRRLVVGDESKAVLKFSSS